MDRIIDGHSHVLTDEYLAFLSQHSALLEDGFALPSWSAENHLNIMEECGIDWTLLSVSSPHPYFGNTEDCIALTRKMNTEIAGLKRQYPEKFGFCASLPLPNIAAAVDEAIYALDVLGADGIKLASNSRGLYLGDPKLDPLFHELDKRNAVVIIHPHRPEPLAEGLFSSGPVPLYEFLCDTTRAVLNMMANSVLLRYPNVKVVVPHCGAFLPNIVSRVGSAQPILMRSGLLDHPFDVKENLSRLYFDIAGSPTPHNLPYLLTIAKPEQLIYGSDYPFTPAPMVKKNLEDLLRFLDESETLKPYRNQILTENARNLFGLY